MAYLLSFLILLTAGLARAATQCYVPDGSPANDSPCNPDADESWCCGGGGYVNTCMSNKLCMDNQHYPPRLMRGTCTDQSWNSSYCPKFCELYDPPDVVLCPWTSTTYCCATDVEIRICDCDTEEGTFELPIAYAINTILPSSGSTSSKVQSTLAPSKYTPAASAGDSSTQNSGNASDTTNDRGSSDSVALGAGLDVGSVSA